MKEILWRSTAYVQSHDLDYCYSMKRLRTSQKLSIIGDIQRSVSYISSTQNFAWKFMFSMLKEMRYRRNRRKFEKIPEIVSIRILQVC